MNNSSIGAIGAVVFCLFVGILHQGCLNTPPASSKEQKPNFSSESHVASRTGRFRLDESGYAFAIELGEATITDYKGPGGKLIVPQEIKGLPVTAIGDGAFFGNQALVQITIPNSVKNIDAHAFQKCSNLTNVVIGNGVTNVASGAFIYCANLRSVRLSDSVTQIGKSAFAGCCNITNLIIGTGVKNIPPYAFHGCSNLTSVVIPDSITNIGAHAFSSCTGLTNVVFGAGLASIENYAFRGCDNLPDDVFPTNIKIIVQLVINGKPDPFAHLRKNTIRDIK